MGRLAKVLPLLRGEYDPLETYESLDIVRYGKKTFACKIDNTIGISPEDENVWMMLTIDGLDGGGAFIDDSQKTTITTYSSSKIEELIDNIDVDIDVDDAMSETSENPVQNKVINKAISDAIDDLDGNIEARLQTMDETIAGKADADHTHSIENVTGLQDALAGKAASTHFHNISDVSGLQEALNAKASTNLASTSAAGLMSADDKAALEKLKVLLGTTLVSGPQSVVAGGTLDLNSINVGA